MPELTLEDRTIVWGNSQGGHAALWEGIIAPRYAPDVNVIGVAADSPATDFAAILTFHSGAPAGAALGSFLVTAYSQFYPDVRFDEAVRPEARDIVQQLANLCFCPEDVVPSQPLLVQLGGAPAVADPNRGALGERIKENIPAGGHPAHTRRAYGSPKV